MFPESARRKSLRPVSDPWREMRLLTEPPGDRGGVKHRQDSTSGVQQPCGRPSWHRSTYPGRRRVAQQRLDLPEGASEASAPATPRHQDNVLRASIGAQGQGVSHPPAEPAGHTSQLCRCFPDVRDRLRHLSSQLVPFQLIAPGSDSRYTSLVPFRYEGEQVGTALAAELPIGSRSNGSPQRAGRKTASQ